MIRDLDMHAASHKSIMDYVNTAGGTRVGRPPRRMVHVHIIIRSIFGICLHFSLLDPFGLFSLSLSLSYLFIYIVTIPSSSGAVITYNQTHFLIY